MKSQAAVRLPTVFFAPSLLDDFFIRGVHFHFHFWRANDREWMDLFISRTNEQFVTWLKDLKVLTYIW